MNRLASALRSGGAGCRFPALLLPAFAVFLSACEPTVRVEAPREPITINLNIQADIRVKIEEQAKQDIQTYENIF